MNRCAFVRVAIVASALAVGCARPPAVHHYLLEPAAGAPAATEGIAVGVLRFAVDPPYDQDRIVYRVGGDRPEIGFYEYHRWAAPLEAMLPRFVVAAFGDLPGVGRIEPYRSDRRYDARIAGRLVRLEEVDETAGPQVRVELVLSLLGPDGATVWSGSASGRGSTPSVTVEGVVERMREALEQALSSRREAVSGGLERLAGRP